MRVLFIDIDTLRPDHLGCYGYGRDTSPNIDRIAEEGVRFDRYYCPNAPCLPSRASLVSGQYGIKTGVVGHGGTAADMRLQGEERDFTSAFSDNNLIHLFRKKGYHTVSVSTFAERHSAWWFNASFNECYNVGGYGGESAERVTPVAVDWIERNAKQDDWVLHVHYWDPHTPYRAPASFGNPFADQPLPDDWITEEIFAEHQNHIGPHGVREIGMWTDAENPQFPRHPGSIGSMQEMKRFMDNYDCGIRYTDDNIGLLLDALRRQGVYDDDLAIIVTSDHGENMGEFGIYGEHGTADEPTCRIPMIIRWPGGRKGITDHAFHANVDLAPTVEELLELPDRYDKFDGISYAKTITDGEPCGHDYLTLTQCAHVCQRSVRFDDYLYIRTYHGGYHLFPREMLFNVREDPHQLHNLAAKQPALCDRGARLLLDWQDRMLQESPSQIDPLWTVMKEGGPYHCRGQLAAYCERLEKTGRGFGVELLRKQYPGEA